MRVLIFSLTYLPFIGGAELAVKEITDRLDGIVFDMVTVNLDGRQPKEETIGNVQVYRLGRSKLAKYFFPWSACTKALALYRQRPYDAIWGIMANQAGWAALRFKKKNPAVPYILTLQEGDSLASIWLRTWFMRPWYKAIYRQADHITAISTYLKNRAIRYGYCGSISVVANGVDVPHFSQTVGSTQLQALRQRLGINENDRVIISVSRLVAKNGLTAAIQAMKSVEGRLVLVGKGKLECKLKSLAQELGLNGKVIFTGYISHQDLPAYLQLADVFIRPSRSEGLGSAFLEAMASGVPIIATPVGGIPDFLIEGQTGWFCEVNHPKSIAEKINFIFNPAHKDLVNSVVIRAKTMVVDRYRWSLVAESMAAVFKRLI